MLTNQIYKEPRRKDTMAKIFLISIMIVTLIASIVAASAADISISRLVYQYKVNTQIAIKNPCYYNGNNCPPVTLCNLTVYDPNNAIIVDNQIMTYNPTYFNYTLPNNNYSIGSYKCDMVCSYAGTSGSQRFYLDVGSGGNMSLFIILAIASILVLGVAVFMQNEYIGFASGALFISTGLFSLIYGIGELSNFYTSSVGYVSLGLGIMFLVAAGYSAAAGSGLFSGGRESEEDF